MKITYEQWSTSGDLPNKTIKLEYFNENYPRVIQSDINGYTLASYDNKGNEIKRQYSLWKFKGKNNMAKIIVDSKWVKAGVNVQKGDVLVIRSEGELIPSQLDPTKKEWHFQVELPDGSVKDAKFNKTSVENLTTGFGTNDSAEWMGKEIVVDDVIKYAKGAGCVYAVKK